MMRMLLVMVALAAAPLAAQQGRVLDRVVAVVGTQPILRSQIEEQIVQLRAQEGAVLPTDSAGWDALRHELLQEMVNDQLLVQQAERDTAIKATEQEVIDQVDQTYQNVRRQFTSDGDFQAQLQQAGFASAEEWRRYLAEQQRRTILRQRLIEVLRQRGTIRPIPPTDSAMRSFFEKNKASLPKRPPVLSLHQIVFAARPDSVARQRALRLADSLANALRSGANFGELARRSSADSASGANGGELGWFRRGVMVKNFEDAAFSMKPGEISNPVETEYGFHIIEVERIQPAEVLARHILIAPVLTDAQIERARRRADSLYAALAGGASFDTLARRFGDPQEPRTVEDVPLSQLGPEYQERLSGDTVLGLQPPFVLGEGTARPRFVILEVFERKAEGDISFDDVRSRIRERLSQELSLQLYLNRLRQETYVDVRL
jgi:peptidyl-prolyl cis-trans isomerase SurA